MTDPTLCYCSSREGADRRPLAWCADCMRWLAAESPRIVRDWDDWLRWGAPRNSALADAVEAVDLAYFEAVR